MTEIYNNPGGDLQKMYKGLRSERVKIRVEEFSKACNKEQAEYEKIQNKYFDLLKSSTILTATIFGSSVALAAGKQINSVFIIGEFFLLIATLTGVLFLWSQLKSLEWSHFFDIKNRMEVDLIVNKDLMQEFEKEATETLVDSYKRLMNKKGVSYQILKIIKVDWLPNLFYVTLFLGLAFIWISLTLP